MLRSVDCICEPRPPRDGWLSIDHADLSDLDQSSVLTLTNLETGKQHVLDLARFRHCFPVSVGDYRVAIHAQSRETFRDIVRVKPGEQTRLRPSMAAVNSQELTLRDVLAKLRAPQIDVSPRNIDFPRNTTTILDKSHEAYAKDWQEIQLLDVDAAKKIIGIDDGDWDVDAPRYGSVAQQSDFTPNALAAAAAKEYIYGASGSVSKWKDTINAEIFKEP